MNFKLDRDSTGKITLQGRVERLEVIAQALFIMILTQAIVQVWL